jgi:hypothetical protein
VALALLEPLLTVYQPGACDCLVQLRNQASDCLEGRSGIHNLEGKIEAVNLHLLNQNAILILQHRSQVVRAVSLHFLVFVF